ncbi:MAG: helix-turn-helix transcriptional regulator [Anaerolineales bacterium]|nr:helix-turn-helix transcriptional regulator [Anaerolineales bacterium]
MKTDSHEDVFTLFDNNPEYRKQKRMTKPYYDLVVEIIQRRNALGMTQKDLAEKAKTFQSRVSKIESAEHDIRLSTLIQIAEALQTEVVIRLAPFTDAAFTSDEEYLILFKTSSNSKPVISEDYTPISEYQGTLELIGN